MRSVWLKLAILAAVSATGCFGSHGGPGDPDGGSDAGSDTGGPDTRPPPIDAGPGCTTTTPYVEALICPESLLEGATARVELTLVNGGCCGGGETRNSVAVGPRGERIIESTMVICDCCGECDCIGPIETTSVDLGPLPPGRHEVRAGDASCVIEVRPALACSPRPATDVRMPRAIFEDQDLALTLLSRESVGCGCTPRIGGDLEFPRMEICDCCEDCRCIDSGYEVGDVRSVDLPVGEHEVFVEGLMPQPLAVRERSSCFELASPPSLRIETTTDLVQGGTPLTWAVLTGEAYVCCSEPMYTVESRRFGDTFELTAYDCVPEFECDCIPVEPTRFESWHALGEVRPGDYRATLAGLILPFTIP